MPFDDGASPWHTLLDVDAPDQPGLFHAITLACAAAGASIVSAVLRTEDGCASDRFELMGRGGEKLDAGTQGAIRRRIEGNDGARPARWRLRSTVSPG